MSEIEQLRKDLLKLIKVAEYMELEETAHFLGVADLTLKQTLDELGGDEIKFRVYQ